MFKTAFFSSFSIPVDLKYLFADRRTINILYPDTIFGNSSDLTVAHNKGTACFCNDRRNIGSDEVFSFTKPNDQRIIFFSANYFLRFLRAHKHQRIRAFNNAQNLLDSFFKISVIIRSHQMCYDFRICFRNKLVTFGDQIFLEHQIVFDNAVMDNNKITAGIRMRMRVTVGRTSMGSPAGMSYTHSTLRHMTFQFLTQRIKTAHTFFNSDLTFFINSNTSGIITAVFQFAHTVQ